MRWARCIQWSDSNAPLRTVSDSVCECTVVFNTTMSTMCDLCCGSHGPPVNSGRKAEVYDIPAVRRRLIEQSCYRVPVRSQLFVPHPVRILTSQRGWSATNTPPPCLSVVPSSLKQETPNVIKLAYSTDSLQSRSFPTASASSCRSVSIRPDPSRPWPYRRPRREAYGGRAKQRGTWGYYAKRFATSLRKPPTAIRRLQ